MKLSLKIPLAVSSAAVMVFACALYGIYTLNQSLTVYGTTVQDNVSNERMVSAVLVEFKFQVQEWKDTLLRGKKTNELDKHWGAFQARERAVDELASDPKSKLSGSDNRELIETFATAHAAMGQGYRKGFDAFKSSSFDPSAGDAAAAGVDRGPSALLEQAARKIAADSAAVSAKAEVDARRSTEISIVLMLVSLGLATLGGYLFSRTVSRPLHEALGCAEAVSRGNLSLDFGTDGKDEVGQLLVALKEMQTSLSNVVSHVRQNAEAVATASGEIASGNLDLSSRTEEQAASLEETAASMDQLTATVRQASDNATQASALAGDASHIASRGGEIMGQVVETMQGIADSSNRITEIIAVIDGIAFQTNILALNAAVEAARAGEHGRGFAVVAAEVRTLAQRCSTAAKEIKGLIQQSTDRVDAGSALVSDAGQIINEIVDSVQRVTTIVGEISTASQEQRIGIEQVNTAVTQMDEVTQQNAALVEQASAAAQALAEQAKSLREATAIFKLRDHISA